MLKQGGFHVFFLVKQVYVEFHPLLSKCIMKHVQVLKKIIYVSKWTLQNMDILWSLNGVMKR